MRTTPAMTTSAVAAGRARGRGGRGRTWACATVLASATLLVLGGRPAGGAPTCTITWTGGAGTNLWNAPANWSTGHVPGTADFTCVPVMSPHVTVTVPSGVTATVKGLTSNEAMAVAGTLTLSDATQPSTVGDLTLSAGTLGGAGPLTVNGAFRWTGGKQTNGGQTVISPTGSLSIDPGPGSAVTWAGGRSIVNDGTATWVSGDITASGGAVLDNEGTFNIRTDGTFCSCDTATTRVNNDGTVTKTAGSGTTTFQGRFDDDGTLSVSIGTVALTGGDGGSASDPSSGTLGATGSGQVSLAGGTFYTGATTRFTGGVNLAGATLKVSGPTHATGVNAFSSGTLAGTDVLTVDGTLNWTGGAMQDTGTTAVGPAGVLNVAPPTGVQAIVRGGRDLSNAGTISWSGGDLSVNDFAQWSNAGTFAISSPGAFVWSTGASPSLVNTGAITKTGPSAITLPIDVENEGTVSVQGGTLVLTGGAGGVNEGGTFSAAAGASMEWGGSNVWLNASAALLGAGTFRVSGGQLTMNAMYAGTGTFSVTGGTADFHVTGSPPGALSVSGGTATFDDPVTWPAVTLSGGTLNGSGSLDVTRSLTWTGGTMQDATVTTVRPGASLSLGAGTGAVTLQGGRSLVNQGAGTWAAGDLRLGDGSILSNPGTLTVDGPRTLSWSAGTAPRFNSSGTLTKTGAGTASIAVPFMNSGTVDVATGTLSLDGAFLNYLGTSRGTLLGGAWVVSGTLRWPGADVAENDADVTFDGSSSLILDATTGLGAFRDFKENTAAGSITVQGGRSVTAQDFVNEGVLTVGAGSTFTTIGSYAQFGGSTVLADPTAAIVASGGLGEVGLADGTFEGVGTFRSTAGGDGLANHATVSPGLDGPGTLTVDGDYDQGAPGELQVDVDGSAPGTGYDRVAVSGVASLDGTLTVRTGAGFSPGVGDAFQVLTFSSFTGGFAAVDGQGLPAGLAYAVRYDPTAVTLQVVPSGVAVSVAGASVSEGDAGTSTLSFPVSLSTPSPNPVSVDYATSDGSATAPSDYAAASGTLTLAPGQVSATVDVSVNGDTAPEPDETLTLTLSNPTNAALGTAQATGTILDDDTAPQADLSVSVADGPDPVAADGAVTYTVTVSNAGPDPAAGVSVTDALPATGMLVSATPSQGSCAGTGPVTCAMGSIPAGSGATVAVVVRPVAPGTMTDTATATSSTQDPSTPNTASQATTVTAQAKTAYVSVTDAGYSPTTVTIQEGWSVQWNFLGPGQHSATDASTLALFDSGPAGPVSYYRTLFVGAAVYPVKDALSANTMKVRVGLGVSPGAGGTSTAFTVTWASIVAPAGFVYDAQVMRPGSTAWSAWKTSVTSRKATFVPDAGTGTYLFRSRVRRVATGGVPTWSVTRSITVS